MAIRDDLDGGLDAVISSLWTRKMWKEEEGRKRMGRSDKQERGMAVAFVDDSQVGELLDAGGWNDW